MSAARSSASVALAAGLAAVAALGASCGGAPGEFIAADSDFAPYRTWTRHALGSIMLVGHPPGPRFAYVSTPAPPGASAYPVGTIILKQIESGATPQDWHLFAMVKRGPEFNAGGAAGWEFFVLRLDTSERPYVVSRGTAPSDPDGDEYASPEGVTCNTCHGSVDARSYSILTPELRPGG